MIGSLYFIQEDGVGAIKIGWTSGDVHRRCDSLQTGNSRPLQVIGAIEGVTQKIEFEWHIRFRDLHCRAEWFHPGRRLLGAIRDEATKTDFRHRKVKRRLADEGVRQGVGVSMVAAWMRDHGHTIETLAEATGYRPAYLSDLLAERQPFGRNSAKRFHALAGDALHPLKTLADMRDRHHIAPFLDRLERGAA